MQKGLILGYKGLLAAVGVLVLALIAAFILTGWGDNLLNYTKSSTGSNRLIIKDLGVAITLPNELKGTTAKKAEIEVSGTNKHTFPPIVNLRLDDYSSLVNKCLGNGAKTSSPYASLAKISGQAPESDKQLLKQFSTFYIDRLAVGVNVTCKDKADQTKLDDLTKRLNDSLQSAFSSAQQI